MNLFRSEEHARNWVDYDPASADGIKPVAEVAEVFSGPVFTERLTPDYVRQLGERLPGLLADLDRLGRGSPFWQMPPPPT